MALQEDVDLRKLLVVEDRDTNYLPQEFRSCPIARSLASGVAHARNKPIAVILDMKIPETDEGRPGYRAHRFLPALLQAAEPTIPNVILVSAHDEIPADEEQKLEEFFEKGVIVAIVSKRSRQMCQLNIRLHVRTIFKLWRHAETGVSDLMGKSRTLDELRRAIKDVAYFDETVLILGEPGAGKELVAHGIRAQSLRADRPFVPVNCALLNEVVESELFGHVRGAFTGADSDRIGLLETANRGTLFLDEIGELRPDIQAALLRFLDRGEIRPKGASQTKKIDVRIICATNRNLAEMVELGQFRRDLYQRLNVNRIVVPPLRHHREDIPELARVFLSRAVSEHQRKLKEHFLSHPDAAKRRFVYPVEFSDEAIKVLNRYSWPGNVRELRNTIHRILPKCRNRVIEYDDMPPDIVKGAKRGVTDVNSQPSPPMGADAIQALVNELSDPENDMWPGLKQRWTQLTSSDEPALIEIIRTRYPHRNIDDWYGRIKKQTSPAPVEHLKALTCIVLGDRAWSRSDLAMALGHFVKKSQRFETRAKGFTNPITDELLVSSLIRTTTDGHGRGKSFCRIDSPS